MQFRSLIRSTRLEILISKRFTFGLYFVFGLAILSWWCIASNQFFRAYFELGELDVSVTDFLLVTLITFMIFVASGAYLISIVILRIRQNLWSRKQLVYSNYKPWINPASAGFVVDYEYSNEETWSTIFYLWNKGVIGMDLSDNKIIITRNLVSEVELKMYEQNLLNRLFQHHNEVRIADVANNDIVAAGFESHEILEKAMLYKGFVDSKIYLTKSVGRTLRGLFFIAGIIGVGLFHEAVFNYEVVSQILYPRYEVHPVEIAGVLIVWTVAILIMLSGFWPRFSNDIDHNPNMIILQATGFRRYLEAVYSEKFKEQNLHLLVKKDLKNIGPYMFAFKLAPIKKSYIVEYIKLVSTF